MHRFSTCLHLPIGTSITFRLSQAPRYSLHRCSHQAGGRRAGLLALPRPRYSFTQGQALPPQLQLSPCLATYLSPSLNSPQPIATTNNNNKNVNMLM